MQLRAIAAYQQAAQHTSAERPRRQPQPAPDEQRQRMPAPLVVEYFTRSGQAQRIATGIHLDKRV